MILPNQSHLFELEPGITYLNTSNMGALLKAAKQAGLEAISKRANPWTITIDDWFAPAEKLRALFARLINSSAENIALVPSASYGIAVAAKNMQMKPGENIVVLEKQYPSNIYAWRELAKKTGACIVTVKRKEGQLWTDALLENIDGNTGLVAIPNCHWTNGTVVDLETVGKRIKDVGAKLVVDASQSTGAYPTDIEKIKPDFLVAVGYKWLLGPYGLGYLYAAEEYCKTAEPVEYTWLNKSGAENFTQLGYVDEYKPGARRFDMGEYPAFINIAMATAAIQQILDWGVENIHETLCLLTKQIEERADKMGLKPQPRHPSAGHVTGIEFTDEHAARLAPKLAENKIFVSFRANNLRIAPHLYNTAQDIDKLFGVIKAVL